MGLFIMDVGGNEPKKIPKGSEIICLSSKLFLRLYLGLAKAPISTGC